MLRVQLSLFSEGPSLPEGLRYEPEIISHKEESRLVEFIETLPLKPFEFAGGFRGNRRVLSFGWRYDFQAQRLSETSSIPFQLLELRNRAAKFSGQPPDSFEQVLVTEYTAGAGIGWHKDKAVFGDVVGVSLLVPCKFRLRRQEGNRWRRASFEAAPRSAYLLSGPSRTVWEHSIPPMGQLRYSVTFRNFVGRKISDQIK
jgi:alkylated DNA repair dioxygenase AlkB